MPLLSSPRTVFTLALLLRLVLLLYGTLQDAFSPLKYTDIDYYVFTDAARFLAHGHSPYTRDTYRYTPLLAWLLYPTSWPGAFWFASGKVLFALCDVLAGWLIYAILRGGGGGSREGSGNGMDETRAIRFASLWLLNPMVAQISTRGSSEGLLCVNVVALLWAVLARRTRVAGVLLGLAVHLKIYPFIYGASILWYLDERTTSGDNSAGKEKKKKGQKTGPMTGVLTFCNRARIEFAIYAAATFLLLSGAMAALYGREFVQHTYLYHLTRIDHRHNFSPYNTLLHITSSASASASPTTHSKPPIRLESLAFIPQLLLSTLLIPLILAKRDLASTMLAQTFAFVTFNKVCTSQYFLWYLVFLPFYLPRSTLLARPRLGLSVAACWVAAQVWWLQQGYQLEFLGRSTFATGLWWSGIAFYFVNVWVLGIVVADIGRGGAVLTWKQKE
ncbi:hypothetical protein EJ05DRAFT_480737 [Pseudovirgaria hyperparasitica]|uniref:GPI mannosyltransferase 1 n=1 Tax=Pseudovirgaria hyperparasitica TaxID=470096 RepID=A0A6A6VS42_9PEZI|nr:uncharacterized protein EJ05DRAFT_480737 [Pseudovirgaria hyperparasitica]KAF2753023.1 hypothetical protein EJ05DRAFT_480737 [Pseudovirgaria hyperparasitica]